MPCTVGLLEVQPPAFVFYDFDEYTRETPASPRRTPSPKRSDLDVKRNTLHVPRAVCHDHVTPPKSGRSRRSLLTERLAAAALKA